jgi:tellurite resistance protein
MKYLPKLSVRDLLWLVAFVALLVMWWTDHKELMEFRKQQAAAERAHAAAQARADEQARIIKQRLEQFMRRAQQETEEAEEAVDAAWLIERSKSRVTPLPSQ